MGFTGNLLFLIFVIISGSSLIVISKKYKFEIFLMLWFLMPNLVYEPFGLLNLPYYTYAQLFFSFSLLLSVLSFSNYEKINYHEIIGYKRMKVFIYISTLMIFCQIMTNIYLFNFLEINYDYRAYYFHLLNDIAGLLFLVSCYFGIRNISKIYNIISFYCLLFTIVVLELYLNLTFGNSFFLHSFSYDEKNIFRSIFINDPKVLGLLTAISIISLIFLSKKNKLWLLLLMFILPFAIICIDRISFLSLSIGLYFYFISYITINTGRLIKILMFFILIPISYLVFIETSELFIEFSRSIFSNEYKLSRVDNFLNLDSLYDRFGIQLRSIEVLVYLFPLGTGIGLLPSFQESFIPSISILDFRYSYELINKGYERVSYALLPTDSHNIFLEHLFSYGFLGLVSLLILLYEIIRNYFLSVRSIEKSYIYAVLLVILIYFTFQSYPRVYVLIFIFYQFSYLLYRGKKR